MSETEIEFHRKQNQFPQVGYCAGFIDRRWQTAEMRKKKRLESYQARKEQAENYSISACPVRFDEGAAEDTTNNNQDIEPDDHSDNYSDTLDADNCKYNFQHFEFNPQDDMPEKYKHIRGGPRSVRPEYYQLIQ